MWKTEKENIFEKNILLLQKCQIAQVVRATQTYNVLSWGGFRFES